MARGPAPSLSLRRLPEGGEVQDPPEPNPPDVLLSSRRLVLLIHGFNNDLEAGTQAYEGFRLVQRELGEISVPLVDVYWPGDADWGVVSFLYYPKSIEKAIQSAEVLARALGAAAQQSGPKEVDLVGHSMGCRLALELLARLQPIAGVLVRRVVLMAGAVPTFMLEPTYTHRLRAAYDAMVAAGGLSLYSGADKVLSQAFPAGQTLGDDEGFFPTALGHEYLGGPAAPATLGQREIPGADHSDYWGWKESTRDLGREANAVVREFLGLGPIPERIRPWRAPVERGAVEERAGTPERQTPVRVPDGA